MWCNALSLNPRSVTKNHAICESHFPDSMYTVKVHKELKDWAIPSLGANKEEAAFLLERIEEEEEDEAAKDDDSIEEIEIFEEIDDQLAEAGELLEIEYILPASNYFKCDICDDLFPTRSERNEHIDKHFRSFKCEKCGGSFVGEKQFEHHKNTQRCGQLPKGIDQRLFECFVCHKEGFFTARSLRIHYNRNHEEQLANQHKQKKCRFCNKTMANVYILKAHIREIHTKSNQFKCDECGKTFNRSANFEWHKLVHKNELPCTCKICGKAFRTISGLNLHKRTHTGEKPYKCDICNEKSYAYNTDLKRHKRSAHGIIDKVWNCDKCESIYYERKFLRKHMSNIHGINI